MCWHKYHNKCICHLAFNLTCSQIINKLRLWLPICQASLRAERKLSADKVKSKGWLDFSKQFQLIGPIYLTFISFHLGGRVMFPVRAIPFEILRGADWRQKIKMCITVHLRILPWAHWYGKCPRSLDGLPNREFQCSGRSTKEWRGPDSFWSDNLWQVQVVLIMCWTDNI